MIESQKELAPFWREIGQDSEEDLQRNLCSMNYRTAKTDLERSFFYNEWLKMVGNICNEFMKASEECLTA